MKASMLKIIIVICVISILGLSYIFDLGHYFSFSYLKSEQENLLSMVNAKPIVSILAFFILYVFVTAVSLPGAAVLTLAAGMLFGFLKGVILVSFASTIGATLAFLTSRYLFRDYIQKKYNEKLSAFYKGVEKEGAFYLFSLRLIPLFPFFVINLLMGLTSLRTGVFFLVSQIGMLPGTLAYVNAGTQISQIQSMKEILSLPIIISFAVLGLVPLVSKKIIDNIRANKLIRKYKRPKEFEYNLIVIGAGSAGLVSAYIASAVKAKVALIEKHKMGGDCLNTGCVPSKALIKSAKILHSAKNSKKYGIESLTAKFEFAEVMERVQGIIKKIEPHDSMERYTKLGVECIEGQAKIISPYEVEVGGKILTSKSIIIATGAGPLVPNIPGLESVKYLTSDNIWNIRELPDKLVVLGGGPIGSELAQCFQRLGSNVCQVEAYDCVLNREDKDISDFICKRLSDEGVNILTNHRAIRVEVEGDKKFVICASEDKEVRVEFDQLLLALGRKANVTGFGLEELGVSISSKGTIEADPFLRTNYPNIYVAGDVTGPYQFTHFAAHQAWFASLNSLLSPFWKFKADYRVIPWCTFTDPEVARVGLNETEAKEKGIQYKVTTYGIDDLDRAIADSSDYGFMKVLTPPKGDKILGATIVGEHAGDLLIEFVTAMKYGLGLNKILGTIHIYPTLSEANKYLAGNWKKSTVSERSLRLLELFHKWRRGSDCKVCSKNNIEVLVK